MEICPKYDHLVSDEGIQQKRGVLTGSPTHQSVREYLRREWKLSHSATLAWQNTLQYALHFLICKRFVHQHRHPFHFCFNSRGIE